MVLVCAFIGMSSISLRSYAADDTCDPEPTDMTVNYGDYILCSIDPEGDSDFYRIWGNEGDLIFVEMISMDGTVNPLLWVTAPNGDTLFNEHDNSSITFSMILTETGTYTINASDWGGAGGSVGQYSMHVVCNGGSCLPAPSGTPAVYDPSSGILSIPEVVVVGTEDRYEVDLKKYPGVRDFFVLEINPIP